MHQHGTCRQVANQIVSGIFIIRSICIGMLLGARSTRDGLLASASARATLLHDRFRETRRRAVLKKDRIYITYVT